MANHPDPQPVPYGAWPSSISASVITLDATTFTGVGWANGRHYVLESRGDEGGRCTIVREEGDGWTELTPPPFNVRSRVHEYGGAAWMVGVANDNTTRLVFSNMTDGRLYLVEDDGGEPRPITPAGPWRYADLQLDIDHNRIICVREDHTLADSEPVNTIVVLSLDGPNHNGGNIVLSGSDFYASPRLNTDRSRLLWLAWNHPNMPWDSTELWSASLHADNTLNDLKLIDGGQSTSITQPQWDTVNRIVYVSDASGWWNVWRAGPGAGSGREQLTHEAAEFATPQWVFGMSNWTFLDDDTVFCSWTHQGTWSVGTCDLTTGALEALDATFSGVIAVTTAGAGNRSRAVFIAETPDTPRQVRTYSPETDDLSTLRESSFILVDPRFIAIAERVSWRDSAGVEAFGFLYLPRNPDVTAPDTELPPLIVESHGGPSSCASTALDLGYQYWTSRGFAILDVDYGGSTGYGRAYRERLDGMWGVVDVDDCVNGALAMAERGLVDPDRMVIRGGSAGGYTTLAALAFRSVFRAGVSYYGIGDLETLATGTHKFESGYLDRLVGPYPEAKTRYEERSPINHLEGLSSAMILFQGLEDRVVPPAQAYAMANAVRVRGLPVALLTFEHEGHGFRDAANVVTALEAELSFFGQVFGFVPADPITPVTVDNLASPA